ncbi:MAG: hypothetical protein US89_C0007G0068 [Candidatus Peregrinibacteria bacterium GW2011_GWF2_38_29]|nr:MAG: hypothetical protein US89_C0007G0068 [Candidatus Peregrinibacteria bacterium GW2011_GWF2_38_29]KKQ71831.1 MAG: hypothetical protein US92_C0003G0066 [Candidatus Peregrinibacteria bacterium GW2011_GWA2_38_36]KKR05234.1 MAG: hypothetical protein UT33_C0012G0039 [Candidatus Peregrinibacteria bacterium GW2011_GWC2_39_14]
MKKCLKIRDKSDIDIETLKIWKKASTRARLDWLESAFKFGKHFGLKKR